MGGRAVTVIALLVVVLAGATVADLIITDAAEEAAATRVTQVLGAPSEVALRGFPVSLRLLLGAGVPEAVVSAVGVPLEASPIAAARLEATLRDVTVSIADLRGPTGTLPVEAGAGTFVADFDAAAVATLLAEPTGGGQVVLGDGTITVTVGGMPVDGTVALAGSDIVVTPTAVAPGVTEVRVPLPVLPVGARIEAVEVVPGFLRFRGSVTDLTGPQ